MADANANKPDGDWAALSSMADGEAGGAAQARCLALWAQRADARARWRDYQLIGDVLRSSELARVEAHDAEFLVALRQRLAREPAPIARGPIAAGVRRLRPWSMPVAAAAGVAAVIGVVMTLRPGAPHAGEQVLAARSAAQPGVASAPAAAGLQMAVQAANGRLIRDARLDRYFSAHRQSATGAALQMPGAGVRNVDTIVLEDR